MTPEKEEDLQEIQRLYNTIVTKLSAIIKPQGKCKTLRQVFGPKHFGTMNELRIDFQMNYPSIRLSIQTSSSSTIDAMLILPHKEGETEEETERRLTQMKRYVKDNKLTSMSLKDLTGHQIESKLFNPDSECRGKSFVLYCGPNAGVYELMSLSDSQVIDIYQKSGIYMLVWNYRGFGYSTGSPGMENIVNDCNSIHKLLKYGFGAEKIAVYGRSLGGHAAKSMAEKADLLIIDRSFSSISFVPRIIFGAKWVQCGYDLFIDNYQTNVKEVINSASHKVLMVDPCVILFDIGRPHHHLPEFSGGRHHF